MERPFEYIKTYWGKFTTPSKKIKESSDQEKARLLLTLLIGVLPPGLIAALLIPLTKGDRIMDPYQDSRYVIYSLGMWIVIFILARSHYYKSAVWMAILTGIVVILFAAVPDNDNEDFFFLSYILIFSGLFFPSKGIIFVYLICMIGISSSILFHPIENFFEILIFPSVMVTIGGLLSIIGSRHFEKIYSTHYKNELLHEAQFRALLENLYDGTAEIQAGIIVRVEDKFARLFGYSSKELTGKSLTQIISRHRAANGENYNFETVGLTSSNEQLHLEVALSPIPSSTTHNQIIAVRNISERKTAEEELKQLALYDPVTGLFNRTQLLKHVTERRLNPRKYLYTSLLFIDIDDFKIINDQYGHEAGDEILREFGLRLKNLVRGEEIVARYGGDEFVIVCDYPMDETYTIARRILSSFCNPFNLRNVSLNLTASLGVVRDICVYTDVDAVLRAADEAMYRAKARGKNQFNFAFPKKSNVR